MRLVPSIVVLAVIVGASAFGAFTFGEANVGDGLMSFSLGAFGLAVVTIGGAFALIAVYAIARRGLPAGESISTELGEGKLSYALTLAPLVFFAGTFVGRYSVPWRLASMNRAYAEFLHGDAIRAADREGGFGHEPPSTLGTVSSREPTHESRNRHPASTPYYGPADRGVAVHAAGDAWALDDVTVLMPASLRASSPKDAKWVAFVLRRHVPTNLAFGDALFGASESAKRIEVERVEIRVVDLATRALVATVLTESRPPDETKAPSRFYPVATDDVAAKLQAVLAPSYRQ